MRPAGGGEGWGAAGAAFGGRDEAEPARGYRKWNREWRSSPKASAISERGRKGGACGTRRSGGMSRGANAVQVQVASDVTEEYGRMAI